VALLHRIWVHTVYGCTLSPHGENYFPPGHNGQSYKPKIGSHEKRMVCATLHIRLLSREANVRFPPRYTVAYRTISMCSTSQQSTYCSLTVHELDTVHRQLRSNNTKAKIRQPNKTHFSFTEFCSVGQFLR